MESAWLRRVLGWHERYVHPHTPQRQLARRLRRWILGPVEPTVSVPSPPLSSLSLSNACARVDRPPASAFHISPVSVFRGILAGERCACWEGEVLFTSSFGLKCCIQFAAGEGDVKRAVRSVGKMLHLWGGGGDAHAPPDMFEADVVDEHGQVQPKRIKFRRSFWRSISQ